MSLEVSLNENYSTIWFIVINISFWIWLDQELSQPPRGESPCVRAAAQR